MNIAKPNQNLSTHVHHKVDDNVVRDNLFEMTVFTILKVTTYVTTGSWQNQAREGLLWS